MPPNPLGQAVRYPERYAPELLHAIPRSSSRDGLLDGDTLPFDGEDIWNCHELTWLDIDGKPVTATATIRIPARSPNLVESKSLKLYLNSLAMARCADADAVAGTIGADLERVTGTGVQVSLQPFGDTAAGSFDQLPGTCIDDEPLVDPVFEVEPSLLRHGESGAVEESLHSHLFRSNCPVTHQPDIGSILVSYRGPSIDRGSLLEYLVSYRRHSAFHEACVEQIFVHLKDRVGPDRLTVYARFNRRGGVDINPFRSDFEASAPNLRLSRQ